MLDSGCLLHQSCKRAEILGPNPARARIRFEAAEADPEKLKSEGCYSKYLFNKCKLIFALTFFKEKKICLT